MDEVAKRIGSTIAAAPAVQDPLIGRGADWVVNACDVAGGAVEPFVNLYWLEVSIGIEFLKLFQKWSSDQSEEPLINYTMSRCRPLFEFVLILRCLVRSSLDDNLKD